MPVELPGEDQGGDPSPWPGMKEREGEPTICNVNTFTFHKLLYHRENS